MTALAVGFGFILVTWFIGVGVLGCTAKLNSVAPRSLAPVIGAAVWVLILEFTRLAPGSVWPLLVAPVVAIAGAGIVWFRVGRSGDLRSLLGDTMPGLVAALTVTAFFVFPWIVDPSLGGALHFTSNHDATHFSSGAQWLLNHSSLDTPNVTATPQPDSDGPAYSAAQATLTLPLRDGFELLLASVMSATGKSAYAVWPGMAAAMGGLIACAATALGRVAGGKRVLSTVAGILVGLTALSSFQIANQNGASMGGIAFAIATLVSWITVVGEQVDEGGSRWNWTGLITTGLCLAAVITVYWEGLPAIAVALLLASFAYIRPVGLRVLVGRVAAVIAVAVITGSIGLWIAFRSVSKISASNPDWARSPFADSPLTSGIAWITGASPYRGPDPPTQPTPGAIWLGLFLMALLVLGLVTTLFVRNMWPVTVGVVVALCFGWWWWGSVAVNAYTHRRFVEFAGVVVVAVATAGWVAIPELQARRAHRRSQTDGGTTSDDREPDAPDTSTGRWSPPVVVATAALLAIGLAISTPAAAQALNFKKARGYGTNYDDVAAMIAPRQGNLLVVVPGLVNQAWIGLAVADRPNTQFLVPCSCLVGATNESYLDGQRPKWILLETDAGTVTGDAQVVAAQSGLALYEVGRGLVSVEAKNRLGKAKSVTYPAE